MTPFQDLQELALPPLLELLTPERVRRYVVANDHLACLFAGTRLTDAHVVALQNLANGERLVARLSAIMLGAEVNNGSPVAHFSYRQAPNLMALAPLFSFIDGVHNGHIRGAAALPFEAIVQVGIGGCELGPRAAYHALRHAKAPIYPLHFLSNLDPHHVQDVMHRVPLEKTLFIVASKSGGTLETHAGLDYIEAMAAAKGMSIVDNMVAVTLPGSRLDDPLRFRQIFYLDPGTGGRFSMSSPVGVLPLGLVFGKDTVLDFLRGAAAQDRYAQVPDIWKNGPLFHAMNSIWERDGLGYSALAVLPYSEPLRFFGQHLQQLICESNGKTTRIDNAPVTMPTSPIVLSDVGTNVQHAVFQAVHQGSDIIPVQFLCIKNELSFEEKFLSNAKLLMASLIGQTVALARGKTDEAPAKCFAGNRPSLIVKLDTLSAEGLGALFSFYECSVIFQGLFWGINSFDQEGVELGKTVTNQAIQNPDELLTAFWEILS